MTPPIPPAPPDPTRPPPDADPGRPFETAAAVLSRRRAAFEHQVRCAELGAERLMLLADRLAGPAREPRDRWYAAWRAAADGVAANDRRAVVAALADASVAFGELDRVAAGWLAAARAWLVRAKAVDNLFGSLVGGWTNHYVRVLPDRAAELRAAAEAADPFWAWALTLSGGGPPSEAARGMRREHLPSVGPVDDALDLLQLFADGGRAAEVGELLRYTAGVGWLDGFTAVVAGAVVPPPPGYAFRPDELPAGEDRRTDAEYLLRLAGGRAAGGHTEQFRRRHLGPADPEPVPTESAVAAASPPARANEPGAAEDRPAGPWVDPGTFALRWGADMVELGNTVEYRLATALLAVRGRYVAVEDLRHQVWDDALVSDNAIQRAVSELRRAWRDVFGGRLVIDGSQRGHYRLLLPPGEGRAGS